MLDPQGHVISWSNGAQRIAQYTAAEVLGKYVGMFHSKEDQDKGEPKRSLDVARAAGKFETNSWRVRKDGTRYMARVVIHPIHNDRGEFVGYAKIMRDETDRQRTQRQIREGTMLRALVDTAVDGVIMIDARGSILMFNPACEKLFGYKAEEVIGQNVKMLMPEPYRGEHDGYLSNYHQTGERKIIGIGREVTGQRKDGSTFPMELSVGEAKQDGQSSFVGIVHDLTERKRTEEQLAQAQKMETVGQLSGGIAHDFNNLLTVIIGNIDLLRENLEMRPDLKQLCDIILNAGERGAALTQRLLAFSRRQTLQPVVIDCNKLVENLRLLLRRTLSEDIDIRIMAEPDLAKAYADPSQLESAILNLALNARDAMPHGGHLTISVGNAALDESYSTTHPEVRPGSYVMIAVTDDGEGMPPDVCARVFEPFFTTKEVGKGSGLGLSMVYGFAKQSNGHVAIYSELGLGTTVRIYVPIAVTAQKAETVSQNTEQLSLQGTETILVVEDDPFVRSHAVRCLESLGYKVLTATDGRDALARLHQIPEIHLLFSDVVMPGGMSGWELAEQARKHRPDIRILMTSGYPVETLTARNRHDPTLALLNKPYRKAELGQRIREILNASPAHSPAAVPLSPADATSATWI
jgi:PAS domain S-box-containing protein